MPVQSVYNESVRAHNGHVTDDDAKRLIDAAKKDNKAGSSGWLCCSVEGSDGTEGLIDVYRSHEDQFEPEAKRRISDWLGKHRVEIAGGKVLCDEIARHRTWQCNWFPMGIRWNNPGANLYLPGGPCDKYDQATGSKCRAYENEHHNTSNGGVTWAGHCDMAARICSLLKQPIRDVTYNGVVFTQNDIQGLLVMVSNDLADPEEKFIGFRNNGNAGDDPSEPYPHVLMPELIKLAESREPYVADVDPGEAVWNYAYDKTKITEFDRPQNGLARMHPSHGGKIRYQTFDLSGTGYDAEIRHFNSWIEYGSDGKKLASGWYKTSADGKNNFDFVWQPKAKGNLSRKSTWPTTCTYNPQVNPQEVYEIYMRSI
ncbi:MAG: hypothetical protein V4534_07050 [Myxococcota bacterium]